MGLVLKSHFHLNNMVYDTIPIDIDDNTKIEILFNVVSLRTQNRIAVLLN